jgi:hypothetical protein
VSLFGFFTHRSDAARLRSFIRNELEPIMAMNELILTAVTNIETQVAATIALCDDLKARLDAQLAIPDGPTAEEIAAVADKLQAATAALSSAVARDTPV